MTRRAWIAVGLIGMALMAGSPAAYAHDPGMEFFPVGTCWYDRQDVVCEGNWPDGGATSRAKVSVRSYNDRPIFAARLDEKGRIRFQRPIGPFVVILNDIRENGQTAEIDWQDIAVTRPRSR